MTPSMREKLKIKPKRAPAVTRAMVAWATLVANPEMLPDELAEACDVSPALALSMVNRHRFMRDFLGPISGDWFADVTAPEPTIH